MYSNDPMGLVPPIVPIIRGIFEVGGVVYTIGSTVDLTIGPPKPYNTVPNGVAKPFYMMIHDLDIRTPVKNSFDALDKNKEENGTPFGTRQFKGVYMWAEVSFYEYDYFSSHDQLGTYTTEKIRILYSRFQNAVTDIQLIFQCIIKLTFSNINGKARVTVGDTTDNNPTVGDNDCTVEIYGTLTVKYVAVEEYAMVITSNEIFGSHQEESTSSSTITYKVNK
jgi:hypothetical protein